MPARIAIATAAEFPDLDEDGPSLLGALADRGLPAEPAVWTDPDVDWSAYDLVVVRCTWDYQDRHAEFLRWAGQVADVTRLANSPEVLAWNTDKTYLRALQGTGLPVVPTDWFEPGDVFVVPEIGEYVVKPAVSAGSRDTNRYHAGDHDELAVAHVGGLLAAGRTVMVQPYLGQVDTYGETALFFFGGVFSHAIRKGPLLTLGDGAGGRRLQGGDRRAARTAPGRAGGGRAAARRPVVRWRRPAATTCSTPVSTWCPPPTGRRPCWSSS